MDATRHKFSPAPSGGASAGLTPATAAAEDEVEIVKSLRQLHKDDDKCKLLMEYLDKQVYLGQQGQQEFYHAYPVLMDMIYGDKARKGWVFSERAVIKKFHSDAIERLREVPGGLRESLDRGRKFGALPGLAGIGVPKQRNDPILKLLLRKGDLVGFVERPDHPAHYMIPKDLAASFAEKAKNPFSRRALLMDLVGVHHGVRQKDGFKIDPKSYPPYEVSEVLLSMKLYYYCVFAYHPLVTQASSSWSSNRYRPPVEHDLVDDLFDFGVDVNKWNPLVEHDVDLHLPDALDVEAPYLVVLRDYLDKLNFQRGQPDMIFLRLVTEVWLNQHPDAKAPNEVQMRAIAILTNHVLWDETDGDLGIGYPHLSKEKQAELELGCARGILYHASLEFFLNTFRNMRTSNSQELERVVGVWVCWLRPPPQWQKPEYAERLEAMVQKFKPIYTEVLGTFLEMAASRFEFSSVYSQNRYLSLVRQVLEEYDKFIVDFVSSNRDDGYALAAAAAGAPKTPVPNGAANGLGGGGVVPKEAGVPGGATSTDPPRSQSPTIFSPTHKMARILSRLSKDAPKMGRAKTNVVAVLKGDQRGWEDGMVIFQNYKGSPDFPLLRLYPYPIDENRLEVGHVGKAAWSCLYKIRDGLHFKRYTTAISDLTSGMQHFEAIFGLFPLVIVVSMIFISAPFTALGVSFLVFVVLLPLFIFFRISIDRVRYDHYRNLFERLFGRRDDMRYQGLTEGIFGKGLRHLLDDLQLNHYPWRHAAVLIWILGALNLPENGKLGMLSIDFYLGIFSLVFLCVDPTLPAKRVREADPDIGGPLRYNPHVVQSYEVAFIVRAALQLDEYLMRHHVRNEGRYILNLRGMAAHFRLRALFFWALFMARAHTGWTAYRWGLVLIGAAAISWMDAGISNIQTVRLSGEWSADPSKGTAAGSTNYSKNPMYKVIVKNKSTLIARLSLDGQSAGTQALNLSLFATADDAPDSLAPGASPTGGASEQLSTNGKAELSRPVSTSHHGSWHPDPSGVPLAQLELMPATYLLVPSTYEPYEGRFALVVHSQPAVSVKQI